MRKNEELTLTCERLGAELEGVCRAENQVVFVPGLLPGETARVRIVKVEKRYAFGRLIALEGEPSPERRAPDCPAYPRCGGCTGRHMSYAATLAAKRRQVEDCLRRIGGVGEIEVPPVLGMAEPGAYRNKTALPAGGTADSPQLGFFAPRSHALIPIERCPNALPPADAIGQAFRRWMREHHVEPYREESGAGLIRHLVVRVNRRGEALVCVVAAKEKLPAEEALAELLRRAGAVTAVVNHNPRRTNVILGRDSRVLFGPGVLEDELCGLRFEVSAGAFFQVNPVQTEVLYRTALDFAGLRPEDTVCDVYCGAGTITLNMARHCAGAVGIEVVPQAIENARANAARNGIRNAEFVCGAAEDELPRMVAAGLRPDVIVVDPPRKGLEEAVIRAIDAAAPRRLVYVSCNVATQSRDIALLRTLGWHLDQVQPVDMFCWTSGVETVVQLSKGEISSKPVRVEFSLEGLDTSCLLNDATYQQIKAYVLEHTGLHVSTLYIAQVKAKHGIIERACYNKAKSEGGRVPKCPPEKEKAIEEALRHFQMIP